MSNANDRCACGLPRARHVDDGPVWSNPGLLRCQGYRPAPQPAPMRADFKCSTCGGPCDGPCEEGDEEYAASQPAPSGDEAKVREILRGIAERHRNSVDEMRPWKLLDSFDACVREAYAAGKADGAREERVAFVNGLTCDDSESVFTGGCSHALCHDVISIARRGSEGK